VNRQMPSQLKIRMTILLQLNMDSVSTKIPKLLLFKKCQKEPQQDSCQDPFKLCLKTI